MRLHFSRSTWAKHFRCRVLIIKHSCTRALHRRERVDRREKHEKFIAMLLGWNKVNLMASSFFPFLVNDLITSLAFPFYDARLLFFMCRYGAWRVVITFLSSSPFRFVSFLPFHQMVNERCTNVKPQTLQNPLEIRCSSSCRMQIVCDHSFFLA